uniref:Uncharacterized protein n=1 Tax=Anguilla anguilla TaxID=7936 RepID=A0A0E9Q4T4_ANGAN
MRPLHNMFQANISVLMYESKYRRNIG